MEEPCAESSSVGTHGRNGEPLLPSTQGQAGAGWGCSSQGGRAGTRLHLIITDNCCRRFLAKSALHLQSQAGEPHSETPAASPEVTAEPGQIPEKSSGEPKGGQEHQLLCKLALWLWAWRAGPAPRAGRTSRLQHVREPGRQLRSLALFLQQMHPPAFAGWDTGGGKSSSSQQGS